MNGITDYMILLISQMVNPLLDLYNISNTLKRNFSEAKIICEISAIV